MSENNTVNVNNVSLDKEKVLITTQGELTNLLKAVKNGEHIDEKYRICMKEYSPKPCVDLFRCFRDGLVAKGAIKDVDDIFQYLVFDFGPNHMWSHDNFTDQRLICEVLSLVCQPGFSINRIKNFELRSAAMVFDLDAIKQNKTKYIFNLKKQMALGTVNQENYSNEVRIQDFLLPDSIDDINDLVKFMGYDSENPQNVVLPKMNYWELMFIAHRVVMSRLKRHYDNPVSDEERNAKFMEIINKCKEQYPNPDNRKVEIKARFDAFLSEKRKAMESSGAIKDFDQLKKIVDFPEDQKLPWTHTMFFADSSVRDGVEFLRLFNDTDKDLILTHSDRFRIFKPGAFRFDNRADIVKFLKEECKFEANKINFISYFIAVIIDLAMMALAIILCVFFVIAYVPRKMCDCSPVVRYTFFEYTRQTYKMGLNESFNLAIKNIEDNCAAGKQLNNRIVISNLGQTILRKDNVPNIDNSLENNSYNCYPTFNNPEDKNNNDEPGLPTLEEIEEESKRKKLQKLQDETKQ